MFATLAILFAPPLALGFAVAVAALRMVGGGR
jgi:hypothetical protein